MTNTARPIPKAPARRRGLSTQARVLLGILGGFLALCLIVAGVVLSQRETPATETASADQVPGKAMRENGHVLGEPGSSGVTFVEFLDLECEACRAAYPLVEQLRADYAGEVTFVVRYFPIEAHANSMNAAIATEAAARQGRFEEMYQRMYETQTEWGEQRESRADLFRTFAADLGLDMSQYDRDVADPSTKARVQLDQQDGLDLGVRGTPTFFLDGELLQPQTVQDFYTAIDQAVAAS